MYIQCRTWRPLGPFCETLMRETQHASTFVMTCCTLLHYDTHHVMVCASGAQSCYMEIKNLPLATWNQYLRYKPSIQASHISLKGLERLRKEMIANVNFGIVQPRGVGSECQRQVLWAARWQSWHQASCRYVVMYFESKQCKQCTGYHSWQSGNYHKLPLVFHILLALTFQPATDLFE